MFITANRVLVCTACIAYRGLQQALPSLQLQCHDVITIEYLRSMIFFCFYTIKGLCSSICYTQFLYYLNYLNSFKSNSLHTIGINYSETRPILETASLFKLLAYLRVPYFILVFLFFGSKNYGVTITIMLTDFVTLEIIDSSQIRAGATYCNFVAWNRLTNKIEVFTLAKFRADHLFEGF